MRALGEGGLASHPQGITCQGPVYQAGVSSLLSVARWSLLGEQF